MRDFYEFNRDAVKEIINNPKEAVKSFLFLGSLFGLLYISLWLQS